MNHEQTATPGPLMVRPFMRWLITVLVLLFAIPFPLVMASMPTTTGPKSGVTTAVLVVALEIFCAIILLAIWLPPRPARIAMRAGAALIGVGMTASALATLVGVAPAPPLAGSQLLRPLLGFFVVGVPCLIFAIVGRVPGRPEKRVVRVSAAPSEQAVLIYLDAISLPDSVYEEHDLSTLEDRISEIIEGAGIGTHDGHEIGEGEAVIFLYGLNAERIFMAIESTLREHPLCEGARVVLRSGAPGAPERRINLSSAGPTT